MKIICVMSFVSILFVSACATQETNLAPSEPAAASRAGDAVASTQPELVEASVASTRLGRGEVLTEKGKKKKSRKRICKYDAHVTSRIRKKTCRTQAEWDYIEKETQKEIERERRDTPNGGRGGPGGVVGGIR